MNDSLEEFVGSLTGHNNKQNSLRSALHDKVDIKLYGVIAKVAETLAP